MATTKKANKPRSIPGDKSQVNFNLSTELLEKVKYIAYYKDVTNSVIYNEAIESFVKDFESKNGKIKPRTK